MKHRLDAIPDTAIKERRHITLPDGTSGTLAGTFGIGDRVHVVLVVDDAHRWIGPLAGDLVATITKEDPCRT